MEYIVPQSQVDIASLPPLLMTSEPGSFAHNTMKVRVPAILREAINLNDYPSEIRADLEELDKELVIGRIRGVREDTADKVFWDEVSALYIGRTWLDVPWYWAEAFFYRRILEATRYFQPGPWQGVDPFAPKKRTEWASGAAPATADAFLRDLPDGTETRFEQAVHASLWGNRTDLSYTIAAHLGGAAAPHEELGNLLADDTSLLWHYLTARGRSRAAIITDNAGTELVMDLVLADLLLAEGLACEVCLHIKPQPFYVSDVMARDVMDALEALPAGGEAAGALATRLRGYLGDGRLALLDHWLYASSLFFFQLPDDLRGRLAAMDLVCVKGDANYRRLVGDVHWTPDTPFAQVTGYFPAPVAALRTFKSEVVVGLRPGQAEDLGAEDPEWRVNGQRGVIQARL
jgi:Damage-control phosphatase ARMT1-like domain